MRIIGGLLLAAMGVIIIASSASISKALGRWEWAERHLGGTMQGFVVIGFVMIILGVMVIFGGNIRPDPTGIQLQ